MTGRIQNWLALRAGFVSRAFACTSIDTVYVTPAQPTGSVELTLVAQGSLPGLDDG